MSVSGTSTWRDGADWGARRKRLVRRAPARHGARAARPAAAAGIEPIAKRSGLHRTQP
jgi:hypothetical protein